VAVSAGGEGGWAEAMGEAAIVAVPVVGEGGGGGLTPGGGSYCGCVS
jgi:hypothetical protein